MRFTLLLGALFLVLPAAAQTPTGPSEIAAYRGLHAAAAKGDAAEITRLIAASEKVDAVDAHRRTPLHVATHFGHQAAAQALFRGGANPNALDAQQYDIITIAAVNNDVPMLELALAGGCNPKNITSPYQGTALIAAAHLGHVEAVKLLIAAKAPLNHVNNLGLTALMEAIVLGNGDAKHTATVRALVEAGADFNIADRQGNTPLQIAHRRGYVEMARILENAGAR